MKIATRMLLFAVIVWVAQYLFIAYVPNIIFGVAQFRKPQPVNTVIHNGPTDATMRKVVLPNPDFIYSACFYDLTDNDLIIEGEFADSTQYCSLSFYGDDVQPYYVRNNMQGFKPKYSIRFSSVNRVVRTLRAKTKKGVILMRILATTPQQMARAKQLQATFKVRTISQNE